MKVSCSSDIRREREDSTGASGVMPVSDCNCFRGAASSESWLDVGARRVFPAGKDERYDMGESEECDDNGMAQLGESIDQKMGGLCTGAPSVALI